MVFIIMTIHKSAHDSNFLSSILLQQDIWVNLWLLYSTLFALRPVQELTWLFFPITFSFALPPSFYFCGMLMSLGVFCTSYMNGIDIDSPYLPLPSPHPHSVNDVWLKVLRAIIYKMIFPSMVKLPTLVKSFFGLIIKTNCLFTFEANVSRVL